MQQQNSLLECILSIHLLPVASFQCSIGVGSLAQNRDQLVIPDTSLHSDDVLLDCWYMEDAAVG